MFSKIKRRNRYDKIWLCFCIAVIMSIIKPNVSLIYAANDSFAIKDGDAVARAVGLALMGMSVLEKMPHVKFAASQTLHTVDPELHTGGFALTARLVNVYKTQANDPSQHHIKGAVVHTDPFRRCVTTGFTATYHLLEDGSIDIGQVSVYPVESSVPRIFFYFVPAEKVPFGFQSNYRHTDFLRQVAGSAVTVRPGQKMDNTLRDYYAFGFVMDRLSAEAEIRMAVSGSGADGSVKSIQRDGWHLVFLPIRLALDGNQPVSFKLYYTPGIHTPGGANKEMLIDAYSSNVSKDYRDLVQKSQQALSTAGYESGTANGQVNARTTAAIKKFQQDHNLRVDGQPSSSLLVMIRLISEQGGATAEGQDDSIGLSPIKIMKMQHWLKSLGYDPGPLDGKMSAKTLEAIEDYKRARAYMKERGESAVGGLPAQTPAVKKTSQKGGKVNVAALFQRYQSKAWRNSVSQPREAKKAEGYSLFPEPLMFVVPADAIRAKSLPGTYAKLLQFVGDRAVPPVKGTLQRREYFIFIFLKDKVSSSSELDIKVSSKSSGEGGYNKGVKSVYLNDRHVTYMSGKMTLFDKSSSSLVYIKAIFKPGKEVGFFSRSAKRVGLFASDGT